MSPIRVNINILYHFFELFYPKFINDQQNVLDIVISDVDKKNKVLGLYLYRTKKVGIHETIETLPKDLIRSKYINFDRLDNFFNKLQAEIMKKTDVRISSIRLFKKGAIDLINKHCEDIRKISLHEFLNRIMDLIQILFEKDLFLIYPKPMFHNFFKGSIELLDKIRFKSVVNFLEKFLPEFKVSFLLGSGNIDIILLLQQRLLKSGKSELSIKILTPGELGIEIEDLNMKNNLKVIQDKLKTKHAYYLNQHDLISFISDLFELVIPIKIENLEFLTQKVLFGYRSFENHWDMVPRPIAYHNFVRFILRLIGFNLNLKKLSHWAIPNLFFSFVKLYFGLNSKILLIITDIRKHKKLKPSQKNYLKFVTEYNFLLEIENSTVSKVNIVNKEIIFPDRNVDSLDSIKVRISEKYGFISSIIVLDKFLLQNFIKNFIFNHSKLSPFLKLKTLKLFKKQKYLRIFPEVPPYQLIRKKRILSFLRLILPIMIDKHEF